MEVVVPSTKVVEVLKYDTYSIVRAIWVSAPAFETDPAVAPWERASLLQLGATLAASACLSVAVTRQPTLIVFPSH